MNTPFKSAIFGVIISIAASNAFADLQATPDIFKELQQSQSLSLLAEKERRDTQANNFPHESLVHTFCARTDIVCGLIVKNRGLYKVMYRDTISNDPGFAVKNF